MLDHGFDHELEEEPGGVEHGVSASARRPDELEGQLFVDVTGVHTLA